MSASLADTLAALARAMAKAGSVDFDEVRSFVEDMAQALGDNAIRENLAALLAALR